LAKEIVGVLKRDDYDAFRLKRNDFVWGKWITHGEVGSFTSVRLVKKGIGKWKRRVHQYFETAGKVGLLENPLLHYPFQDLYSFITKIEMWSSLHAIANMEEGKHSTVGKVVFYPVGHFVKNYLIRLGYLDGMQGFVFALVMAGHSFLAWSKQWLLQRQHT